MDDGWMPAARARRGRERGARERERGARERERGGMTTRVSVVDAVRGMAEAVTSDAGMTASATILCASVVGLALARVAR